MEWRKGNTFGATAFTSYGFFWLTLVAIWLFPVLGLAGCGDQADDGVLPGTMGVFTAYMFVGTLRTNCGLQFVFLTLPCSSSGWLQGTLPALASPTVASGYLGIICGASAVYVAMAEVLNETYGRMVLPLACGCQEQYGDRRGGVARRSW